MYLDACVFSFFVHRCFSFGSDVFRDELLSTIEPGGSQVSLHVGN